MNGENNSDQNGAHQGADEGARPAAVHLHHADWIVRVVLTRMVAVWALALGAGFTIGGFSRISGPSFATIARVPMAPGSWGIPLALAGLLVLALSWRPVVLDKRGWHERGVMMTALFFMAVWNLSFAIAFVLQIFANPLASVSGPFTYLMVAMLCVVLVVSHRTWDSHE